MIRFTKKFCFALIFVVPALAESSIQDTDKAAQYFADKLNFEINTFGVQKIVDGKVSNAVIIDVRSAKAYAEGHIPGSINIPAEKYDDFEGAQADFPDLSKDKVNVVYCYVPGCNLSQKAAKKFASLGYPVKEMIGGFKAWKDEGRPVK